MRINLGVLPEKLRGFRGLLIVLATYVSMYIASALDSLTGITPDNLKAAAITSIPIALKLIWTDAWPRIMEWLNDE